VDLLFTRLDYSARIQGAKEVLLSKNAVLRKRPQIVHVQREYGVLFQTKSDTQLIRLDEEGSAKGKLSSFGPTHSATLAGLPGGYAVLYSPKVSGASPLLFARFSTTASLGETKLDAASSYWLPWIVQRAPFFAVGWANKFLLLNDLAQPQGLPTSPLAETAISAPSYAASGSGYGVVYARATDFMVRGQRIDTTGKPVGKPASIVHANIGTAPLQQLFLAWTGSQYILAYPDEKGGRPTVQLLDEQLGPIGDPLTLPSCLSLNTGQISAAYGNGRFAVAYVGSLSGPVGSAVCVAITECK
jgi:hypothetical protein